VVLCLFGLFTINAAVAGAQAFEVAPFGGYRFGGDLFEVYTGKALDTDGAPSFGVTLDLFVDRGASVSFLYSRQQVRAEPVDSWGVRTTAVDLFAEHWHLGGAYELPGDRVRPFLAGGVGLTRFGSAHDTEVRFSASGGGGVKVMASRNVGMRFDGRAYAVFVDGRLGPSACGGGACLINLDVFVVWQVEFTAGLVVAF
jgi:hypothetical protein